MPLHGRYKAVTLRSCNVDPCIRTRISRGFQNCAQIDLNRHARKTIRGKPQITLPSTYRVPTSTLQNSWKIRDRWRCPNLLSFTTRELSCRFWHLRFGGCCYPPSPSFAKLHACTGRVRDQSSALNHCSMPRCVGMAASWPWPHPYWARTGFF